jgi:hypothetical protein
MGVVIGLRARQFCAFLRSGVELSERGIGLACAGTTAQSQEHGKNASHLQHGIREDNARLSWSREIGRLTDPAQQVRSASSRRRAARPVANRICSATFDQLLPFAKRSDGEVAAQSVFE